MAKIEREDAIAVVTVHGTGDTATGPDGAKWWQRGSAFAQRLTARLQAQGVKAEIVPHFWSGANSASDRESGADGLAVLIKKCAAKYKGVHVVGHSHGGNVANDAADFLRWGRRRLRRNTRDEISSVTTVGTPFFNSKTGVAQRGAGRAFMLQAWGSAIIFPLIVLAWLVGLVAQYVLARETVADRYATAQAANEPLTLPIEQAIQNEFTGLHVQAGFWLLYVVVVGLAVRFMWRMSTRGIRRAMRPKRMKDAPVQIFSLWHPNDEAISFLQKIENAPIEAFPKGALYRGSRSSAVGLGVLATILLGALAALFLLASIKFAPAQTIVEPWFRELSASDVTAGQDANELSLVLFFFSVGVIIAAPVVFALFYLIYRYVIGNLLELSVRGLLNSRVAGTLRGIAYGKDGDQTLCNISTTSHTLHCRELMLSGDCAARMQQGAAAAANKLLEKYRWALFSVGADTNASLNELSTDAMTWDSLVHTTYFDQQEVADAIGDHIATEAKRLGEVEPGAWQA